MALKILGVALTVGEEGVALTVGKKGVALVGETVASHLTALHAPEGKVHLLYSDNSDREGSICV